MIDIMAIGAHPDDIEIFMGGTLALLTDKGKTVAIVDLTRGENGTYGTVETREKEAQQASEILGVEFRENLNMPDGFLADSKENRLAVVDIIRKYQPRVVFCFFEDSTRHPDHRAAGKLVKQAVFLAGLEKIRTDHPAHRVQTLFQFGELFLLRKPDFVINISTVREKKINAIKAYETQVRTENTLHKSKTFLKSQSFWDLLLSRDVQCGSLMGVQYAEGFYSPFPVGLNEEFKLL